MISAFQETDQWSIPPAGFGAQSYNMGIYAVLENPTPIRSPIY